MNPETKAEQMYMIELTRQMGRVSQLKSEIARRYVQVAGIDVSQIRYDDVGIIICGEYTNDGTKTPYLSITADNKWKSEHGHLHYFEDDPISSMDKLLEQFGACTDEDIIFLMKRTIKEVNRLRRIEKIFDKHTSKKLKELIHLRRITTWDENSLLVGAHVQGNRIKFLKGLISALEQKLSELKRTK